MIGNICLPFCERRGFCQRRGSTRPAPGSAGQGTCVSLQTVTARGRFPVRSGWWAGNAARGPRCRSAAPAAARAGRGAAAPRAAARPGFRRAGRGSPRPGRRGRCGAGHDAPAGPAPGAAGTASARRRARPGPARAPGRCRRHRDRRARPARSLPAGTREPATSAGFRKRSRPGRRERGGRRVRVVSGEPQRRSGNACLRAVAVVYTEAGEGLLAALGVAETHQGVQQPSSVSRDKRVRWGEAVSEPLGGPECSQRLPVPAVRKLEPPHLPHRARHLGGDAGRGSRRRG